MTYSALNNFHKGLVSRFAPNLTRRTLEVERPAPFRSYEQEVCTGES